MGRKIDFNKDFYYHIFNRGVDKRKIFSKKGDLQYFLDNLIILNREERVESRLNEGRRKKEKQEAKNHKPIVAIVAYALLPNHFHLILKETKKSGISKFMQKLGTSYTMFFNEKYDRSGVLFQGKFKATEAIDLVAMTSYVNLNYVHHGYNSKNDIFRTSWFEYTDSENVQEYICNKEEVKSVIQTSGGVDKYKKEATEWSKTFVESHSRDKKFQL